MSKQHHSTVKTAALVSLFALAACSSAPTGLIGSTGDDPAVASAPEQPSSTSSHTAPASTTSPASESPSTSPSSAPSTPPAEPPPSGAVALDVGVTDTIDDLGFSFEQARADGLTRTSIYTRWRDLEPSDGHYQLEYVDAVVAKAKAAGLKLTVEIEITNTDCVEWGMTDAFCVAPLFPADLAFSRAGAAFDDPNIARRLAGLFNAIAARHGATVVTHVFVGNEVDRYMAVVKHDSGIDLVPAYGRMLGAIRAKLTTAARPKFGTVVEYQPSPEYAAAPPVACPNVEVLGMTMYPTEEGAEGTDTPTNKIQRWMAAARLAAVGSCSLAITEVGASALSPYGSLTDQQALASAVVEWLRANPKTYDFATWFAMSDNPSPTESVFGGMGLMTRTGVRRPAYATWLAAGKAAL